MLHFNPKNFHGFKQVFFTLSLIISFVKVQSQVFPVDTLMRNGERSNRINLVYLSDGYLAGQLLSFTPNATTINDALFSQTPFLQYKNFFNAYAIKSPSAGSGAKHPRTASDEGSSGGQPVINPDNYFGSTFDFFAIHRLLVPQNTSRINDVLASNLPDYDQAFVVVNSPYYGGSGGAFSTASTQPSSAEVAIHELGHSFAGLADEYWAGDAYAAEKANMTQNNNPATVKWKNWYGKNGIGIYAYGSTPPPSTWYKPHLTCKMQTLGYPFCSVCAEKIIDHIHELVNLIDTHLPAATSFTLTNTDSINLSITSLQNTPSTIEVKWYLNGSATPFATNQNAVSIPFITLNNGNNTVRTELTDKTALSKSFLPAAGYINNLTWTINKPAALPVHLKSFSGSLINDQGVLNWEIEQPQDLQTFELEKSRDGNNFSLLATIHGEPVKRKYTFTDANLFLPFSFYRLKTIEKSGAVFYSGVIRLQNAFEKSMYKVYQNAELHKYHLTCIVNNKENVSIKVIDIAGRQVYRKNIAKASQQLDLDINLGDKPAGVYFLNITIGEKNYTVQLLAK